jgi:hypothetical protein
VKSPPKAGFGNFLFGLLGAIGAWLSLVQLTGSPDPIFGFKESPAWAAAGAIVGIFFMAGAVAFWVKYLKDNDSEK